MEGKNKVAYVLTIIGGLNWGLVGLGSLIASTEWNVVNWIFGGFANGLVANIIYIAVGISAIVLIFKR